MGKIVYVKSNVLFVLERFKNHFKTRDSHTKYKRRSTKIDSYRVSSTIIAELIQLGPQTEIDNNNNQKKNCEVCVINILIHIWLNSTAEEVVRNLLYYPTKYLYTGWLMISYICELHKRVNGLMIRKTDNASRASVCGVNDKYIYNNHIFISNWYADSNS